MYNGEVAFEKGQDAQTDGPVILLLAIFIFEKEFLSDVPYSLYIPY